MRRVAALGILVAFVLALVGLAIAAMVSAIPAEIAIWQRNPMDVIVGSLLGVGFMVVVFGGMWLVLWAVRQLT